ncbi:MAG: pyruvate dehydrogenase (acetyl-transferring), homodimeric type [Gammaproteobacteria bacterium]
MSEVINTADIDPIETNEWLDAITSVIEREGSERAKFILAEVMKHAREKGTDMPFGLNSPYVNTIPVSEEPDYPGDRDLERHIVSINRWNAVAMVLHAGKKAPELGGHIATYASAATLYEVGFNHFFRGPDDKLGADLLYIQGHSSPGIYARSFLEGRLSQDQLDHFRQEVEADGLTSYPHPWLMPEYWQFATVSMGLGPMQAIYQARFLKYLHNRGLVETEGRKVWAFCGDGEMDEPESLGAISLAGREKLDNLIFVINCNLQRLDGPVRGNSKIVQELESVFRGAGWNVIKVLWGGRWDPLFENDKTGVIVKRMEECVDGDYQNFKAHDGAYVREEFFNKYPELAELVKDMTDEEIWRLNRGGHDPKKVYAAYAAATAHKGQPTVILAKTVKGYGMGAAGEGLNITHQQKKMSVDDLKYFRERFDIPVSDEQVEKAAFYRPSDDSPEVTYVRSKRKALGGYLPSRRPNSTPLEIPPLETFANLLQATGDRHISTTMAYVRFLTTLVKDKNIGSRVVPIVPDEARTFGMEGMFRQIGIYSSVGQLYKPVDSKQVMFYHESENGQILEEGINEAGAMCSWMAAGNTYSTCNYPMIPFYIYYSMFGFQRIGDLAWAAGDMQIKGFLLGATAGRTTLAGEGLQHQDGHSHIFASTIPNCRAYDPTYSYELAVILHDGLKRMFQDDEHVFYYISLMNENYEHPEMPKGVEEGIVKGMYLFKEGNKKHKARVQLLGSGTILNEVIAAGEMLEKDYGIACDIWSVTSFNELRRDAMNIERENLLSTSGKPKSSYVQTCLKDCKGPIIAATDYIRLYADQIRPYITQKYVTLGTDGFGRSDTREKLRHFFEVDKKYIVYTTLKTLADEGEFDHKKLQDVMKKLGINPKKPNPETV